MTITLPPSAARLLAAEFAQTVLHQVTITRLAARGVTAVQPHDRLQIEQLREALRSIPMAAERRAMIFLIGMAFRSLRQDRGMEIRGRDRMARLMAHRSALAA